jgi:hypothetical protein
MTPAAPHTLRNVFTISTSTIAHGESPGPTCFPHNTFIPSDSSSHHRCCRHTIDSLGRNRYECLMVRHVAGAFAAVTTSWTVFHVHVHTQHTTTVCTPYPGASFCAVRGSIDHRILLTARGSRREGTYTHQLTGASTGTRRSARTRHRAGIASSNASVSRHERRPYVLSAHWGRAADADAGRYDHDDLKRYKPDFAALN